MKLSDQEQEQIVRLLTRIYSDVAAIETDFGIFVGNGDFRPRIEYFHDAVRALTSSETRHLEEGGRLSIEILAYDLSCLRYIQSMPLSPFTKGEINSPASGMVALDSKPVAGTKRPDRKTKEHLVELYKNYAVLYAAILKPIADNDYHERTDNLNHDVKDIHAIIKQFEKSDMNAAARLVQNLEDEGLRGELIAYLQQAKAAKPENIKKIVSYLKERIKKKDKGLKTIEKAHMDYGLTQLNLFENSRDMLKKMAANGMNLVGNFVEASIAETRREMGR